MNITDSYLMTCNKMGLIPGPEEYEEDFLKRIDYCLHLKDKMASEDNLELPSEMQTIPKDLADEMSKITLPLFDIAPNWIPVIYSNQKLTPWHGGCAWI